MFSGNFKAAMNSVRASRWRSLLTMMGVIIGITLVVTIVSLGEGLKHQVVGQVNQLGTDVLTVRSGKVVTRDASGQVKGVNVLSFLDPSTLTVKDVAALKSLQSVSSVTPMAFVTSSVTSDSGALNNVYVIGTSPSLPDLFHQKVTYGDFFTGSDNERFAVIGAGIAHKLYGSLNPVGHSISIADESYIIRGVLQESRGGLLSIGQTDFNAAVLIPFEHAEKLTGEKPNILQILVKSKGPDTQATIREVRQALLTNHQNREDFSVLKQEELLEVVNSVVNRLTGFVSALAGISLLIGGIGIMSIMLASVSERTREIGIRKAIGATNRQILNQFLVEGLVLTVVGGVIGIIISLLIFVMLRLYTNLEPVITIPIIVLAAGVAILVGIIFSIAPALKASRKDPIQALRGD